MIKDNYIRIVVNESPIHYYRIIQTDVVNESIVDPSFSSTSIRDFVIEEKRTTVPTAVESALQITTNVGTAIVNDIYNVTADVTNTKYVKISVIRVDATQALEILVSEKTTGAYDSIPAGKTLEQDIREFSVIANGTVLVPTV